VQAHLCRFIWTAEALALYSNQLASYIVSPAAARRSITTAGGTRHADLAAAAAAIVIAAAGHMVPQTRPIEALDMFSRFINKQPLQPEDK
jgi:carboxypeptidase C (cathepsin A)